jgi:hypothetical protein
LSKIYTTRQFREDVVGILLSSALIEKLKEHEERNKELFGPGWKYLKQAGTLIVKSMHAGLSLVIGQEESAKIHEIVRKHQIIMLRKGAPTPKDFVPIESDKLFNLAEHAIANKCVGCTIEKHKECSLFQALDQIDMPPACYEKGKCPYLQ